MIDAFLVRVRVVLAATLVHALVRGHEDCVAVRDRRTNSGDEVRGEGERHL